MKTLSYFNAEYFRNNVTQISEDTNLMTYLKMFSSIQEGALDRTKSTNLPLNFEVKNRLTPLISPSPSYADVCNDRAVQLLTDIEKNNVSLTVLWSGGVDSTTVLSSFLMNASKSQMQNINVLLNQNSIKENPVFFKKHILGKLNYISSYKFNEDMLVNSNSWFINGENNGQLYGEDRSLGFSNQTSSIPTVATVESIKKLIKVDVSEDERTKLAAGLKFVLQKSANSIGINLIFDHQYIYWVQLNFRIQGTNMRAVSFFRYGVKTNPSNIKSFFTHPKFDQWGMNRMMTDYFSPIYRKESKDYIFSFDRNQEYYDTKDKMNSGGVLNASRKSYPLLDNNYMPVDISKLHEYYNEKNNILSSIR